MSDKAIRIALLRAIRDEIRENGQPKDQSPELRAGLRQRILARSGLPLEAVAEAATELMKLTSIVESNIYRVFIEAAEGN